MKAHHYGVIIAGGKGTRFWPLSRPAYPKQLLRIFGEKSLIQQTVDRVSPLFGRTRLLVVTVSGHDKAIRRELGLLPTANFLIEPRGNNTAPCIGLAAIELSARDPEGIMVVLPADHWVADAQAFARALKVAIKLAETHDALVTLGIKPEYPETGYGYILRGKKVPGSPGASAFHVRGFKEKPSLPKARQLLRSGALWNSGIFVWRARTILGAIERYAPSLFAGLHRIMAAGGGLGIASPRLRAVVRREYRKMPNVSIDYAVLEKAGSENKVLTVAARFGWSDVGNWAAVHRMLAKDGRQNAGVGHWLSLRSSRCLAYSPKRLIALLGMEDTVVIDTPDAVLVGNLKRAQEVKDLVGELERRGYGRYTR
ncbi:MAG: mannose-1-phosphate guanylyltransferase [Deltaproteobacteria bacterium]|nr:mannose-1-phosphate guanylyltransferase [Deltaproteobacteria bacterium]